jgi:hypothetical protein
MKVSASNNSLLMKNSSSQQFSNFNNNFNNSNNTRLDSVTNNINIINNHNYDSIYASAANARQLDCNKSIDLAQNLATTSSSQPNKESPDEATAEHSPISGKSKIRRNSSVISFKSIYSSFRRDKGGHSGEQSKTKSGAATTSTTSIESRIRTPYVKVETVDQDEEYSMLTYLQSPGGSQQQRRISDTSTTILDSTHYLATNNYQELSQSQQSSSFLSVLSPSNIRRSSTSDIMEKNPSTLSTSTVAVDSRRPSSSDLLRRNRERKGSEGKIGRSSSHGSVSRGAMRSRRSSMAC